jgi:putative PIN family toxin of toxin-antitoxin system
VTIVLDTNVVIRMFGRQSTLRRLMEAVSYGEISVALSPAIWLEYEEVCQELRSPGHWEKLQKLFTLVSNAHGTIIHTNPAFRFQTIPSVPDDNAFADCAIAAHAYFILTDDGDYQTLRNAGYKPQPMRPEEFIARHLKP